MSLASQYRNLPFNHTNSKVVFLDRWQDEETAVNLAGDIRKQR